MKKEVEFVVDQTSLQTISTAVINANWAEMEEALVERIAPYKGLVVDRDAIADAKADRAKINKTIKTLEDYRKTVKKLASAPITMFEEQCKKLVAICKDGEENISRQLKAFEEEEREARIDSLKEYFEQAEKKHPEYICFNDIVKPEWATKSFGEGKARAEIDLAIKQSDVDVDTLMSINKSWTPYLLNEYKETHDLRKVLAINNKYNQIEAEQERQIQKNREEKTLHKEPIGKTPPKVVPELAEFRPEYVKAETDAEVELLTVSFTVTGTEADLNGLQDYMDSKGIKWEVK